MKTCVRCGEPNDTARPTCQQCRWISPLLLVCTLAGTLAGCGATLADRQATMERQLCLAKADVAAMADADKVCPDRWGDDCEHRPRILAEHSAAYEACPQ